MGKRKRPADATTVQYEQAPSRGRIVQTVQDKAGNLYNLQNDSGQQSGQTTTTTYYQIHTKVQPSESSGSVIQTHRTAGGQMHQTQVVQQQQPPPQPQSENSVTFKCVKCDDIYESKDVFMEHCKQFHIFSCDLCTNCIFNDLIELNVHMLKHMNKYDMCEKCNMLCNSTEELKSHLGGHITTYDKNEVVYTNNGQANALSDDSLIEHLASELDQSIGNTVKVKPQKYRCGVCKQDFSDPKTLFKHMNQVHINLQAQVIQQQLANNPSPPLPPPPPQTTIQVAQQQQQQQQQPTQPTTTTTTLQENVVYTNIDSNNIFYDERTGQYYTIALMDNPSPLSDAGGSGQSVIEYVQDAANLQQVQQHIEYIEDGQQSQETIIIEDESQHSHISQHQQQQHQQTHNKISHSHVINSKQQVALQNTSAATTTTSGPTISSDPPPLVQITRDTDLEELIPTTTLVADTPQTQKVAKHDLSNAGNHHKQSGLTKCENCQTTFVKKLPKQMFCHNCVTRNTAANKH